MRIHFGPPCEKHVSAERSKAILTAGQSLENGVLLGAIEGGWFADLLPRAGVPPSVIPRKSEIRFRPTG